MTLELFAPNTPVRVGDRLVSFGSPGTRPFVPGVPLGVVTEVDVTPGALKRTARVRPYVGFTSLDVVGVVVEPLRGADPRDRLLPATPTARPSAAPSGTP